MRKIIFWVLLLLVTAIVFVYFFPVKRTFHFKLIVQATPALVYEELLQNTSWENWYFSSTISKIHNLSIQPVKQDEIITYQLNNKKDRNINGAFNISISLEGGSFLEWNETIHLSKGLGNKIQLLFRPGIYEESLRNSLYKLKDHLEKPTEVEAGVRFRVYQMKGHAIAVLNDTVSLANAEQKITQLYQKIRSQLNPLFFKDTNRLTSRYELLNEKTIKLQVGLRMNDATLSVPSPLTRLEVPSVLIVVASAKANYGQIEKIEQITHDWVNKYNLKLASPLWYEHSIRWQNGNYQLGDTLRIIQPFYYWRQPVPDTY